MDPSRSIDIYQLLTWGFGLVGLLLSGGTVGIWLKLRSERKTRDADAKKTSAETDAILIDNDTERLTAIGASNKTINDLLIESNAHVKAMVELTGQLGKAKVEIVQLTGQVNNGTAIIEYQKSERHEWTEQLKKVLQELAEATLKIEELTNRVLELERINHELTQTHQKTVNTDHPIEVTLVDKPTE